MRVSLVIPTYNSASFIKGNVLDIISELPVEVNEILVVDDGSTDDTFDILKLLADQHPAIRVLRLSVNCGQSYSTAIGIKLASNQFVVTFDDDLQYGVKEIRKLIDAGIATNDFQVIYGYPKHKQHKKSYNIFTHVTIYLLRTFFIPNLKRIKGVSSFVLLNKDALEKSIFNPIYVWDLDPERIHNVEVEHKISRSRASNYTVGKYFRHFLPLLLYIAKRALIGVCLVFAVALAYSGHWVWVIVALLIFLMLNYTLGSFLRKLKYEKPGVEEYHPIR